MALIIISGQPSSGKSTFSRRLQKLVEEHGKECRLISEETLGLSRGSCYKDATCEKLTRGQLKSEVERSTARQAVVILDSINGIKGFRYELHCIARGAAVRYCMVHVDVPPETCRAWNQRRQDAYPPEVLDDLLARFERPDSKFRWEAPLFTIRPATDGEDATSMAADAVVSCALDLARPSSGSEAQLPVPVTQALKPTIATTNAKLSTTNLLHEIDQATHVVMDAITRAQEQRPGLASGIIQFQEEGVPPLRMDRPMSIVELRRHKRAFLRLVTNLSLTKAPNAQTAQRMFVDFLSDQLSQN